MDLYGLIVNVNNNEFSFSPTINNENYSMSNISSAYIKVSSIPENETSTISFKSVDSLVLTISDFSSLPAGNYELNMVLEDSSNKNYVFPNLGSSLLTVSSTSISIEGNSLSSQMVSEIYNKMKSDVIQGATGPQGPKGDTGEQGPQGEQGSTGPAGANGKSPTVTIGTTSVASDENPAKVTNSGTDTDVVLDFVLPKGQQGPQGEIGPQGPQGPKGDTGEQGPQGEQGSTGPAGANGKSPTVTIGTTSVASDENPAKVTNSGTDTDVVLDFVLPKGQQGPQGPKGDTGEQGPQGEQGSTGPKGDKGEQGEAGQSATVQVGNSSSYVPWIVYDSNGKDYYKGNVNADGDHPTDGDVTTDYFQTYKNDTYCISIPPSLNTSSQQSWCRVCWYDKNKTYVSRNEWSTATYPNTLTAQAPCDGFARFSMWVEHNQYTTGTNQHVVVTDIGKPSITNSGNDTNAVFNFQGFGGATGLTGPQGLMGPQGPEGTLGDYVTSTGWLDLTPYMNSGDNGVWCGWKNNNTTGDIGWNRYCITQLNGQNIFWFRIHSRFKDASIANTWGTKLFDIPQGIVPQMGSMERSQYNTMYECSGTPCMYQLVFGDKYHPNDRWVQTLGTLQLHYNHNGDQTIPAPSGTCTVNMFGWFVI